MSDWEDADKTIFSGDLDSEERSAVKSGEKRGEKIAMQEDPKRFGLARQGALGRKKYAVNYVRAFGHE